MGALIGTVCHSSQADAANAFFTDGGVFFTSGAVSYQSWFELVGSVWTLKRQSIAPDGTVTNLASVAATIPSFPGCDPVEPFNDGMLVGWGIATVMVMAWGFSKIRQQAR